ncbi:LacI family DNA-binding transcriptional regulator [Paenibacillus macerans]|uniref:LacI family DNA-binding transcriptional regulator n=1 Tax=Paenibacillus macerans TaxID=44252 RepID=A0A6N8EYL5_PAEMA|nr:LacI family DNA-binding transcriptional regulator [Paenibacillus macerans]MUG23482.1 LacI family DNA-binding transcriptional regulator [Paenibacillus macerans]
MPTIHDISRRSGVSKSTVSRVLNDHPHVSKESRDKVLRAVRELAYVRNAHGVQLRLQSNRMIGVIVPDLNRPYFSELVSALGKSFSEHGLKVVVHQTYFSRELEWEVYGKLVRQEMDAVIITHSLFTEQEVRELAGSSVALVCNEPFPGKWLDVFALDEADAIYQAAAHLLAKGRRNLIFCMDHRTPLQDKRWEGFKSAHRHFGLPCTEAQRFGGIHQVQDGFALGLELFASEQKPDGIVAGSDEAAAGFLRAAKTCGVIVPEETAVIGFDDHPICLVTTPELTTVQNRIADMVRDVTDCLNRRLRGEAFAPMLRSYKAVLIERGSS